jgi:hypothetical protein
MVVRHFYLAVWMLPGAARQTPPTQTSDQQAAPFFRAASTWKPGSDIGALPLTLRLGADMSETRDHCSDVTGMLESLQLPVVVQPVSSHCEQSFWVQR